MALPLVTQTKIAYRAWLPGWTTLPLSDWTEMHILPLGGGGGGVDDCDGDGLGDAEGLVAVGLGVTDLFGDGRGDWSGVGDVLGLAFGDVLGLAVAEAVGLGELFGEPGLTEELELAEADGLGFLLALVPSRSTSAVK